MVLELEGFASCWFVLSIDVQFIVNHCYHVCWDSEISVEGFNGLCQCVDSLLLVVMFFDFYSILF